MNDELLCIFARSIAQALELAIEANPKISEADLKAKAVNLAGAFKAGVKTLSEGS